MVADAGWQGTHLARLDSDRDLVRVRVRIRVRVTVTATATVTVRVRVRVDRERDLADAAALGQTPPVACGHPEDIGVEPG